MTVSFCEPVRALRQFVAQSLTERDLPDHAEHRPGITEPDRSVDIPSLRHLHGTGDSCPGGDGIKPEIVAEGICPGDHGEVIDPTVGTQSPDTFILRPFHSFPSDLHPPPASDEAVLAAHLAL